MYCIYFFLLYLICNYCLFRVLFPHLLYGVGFYVHLICVRMCVRERV